MKTEQEFLAAVIELCLQRGYLVHACNSATQCKGRGLPDLIIASPKGVIFAELKAHSMSKVSSEQTTWGHTLRASGQHYRRWTIADWESRNVHAELDRLGVADNSWPSRWLNGTYHARFHDARQADDGQ